MSFVNQSSVLENTDNIRVSGNEPLYNYQVNRNIKKLIENDKELYDLFQKINGTIFISEFIEGKSYQINDLIWFFDEDLNELKLLRCIIRNNTITPEFDGESYEKTGWRDENESTSIEDMGLQVLIKRLISNNISLHEQNTQYHKYGKLKNYEIDVDENIMKKDLSNRNKDRDSVLYPYKNVALQSDNTIINGFYRKYDNGLIEYDIIFKLGYQGTETIDDIEYDKIMCNNIDSSTENNDNYFYSSNDYDIFSFKNNDSKNFCNINGTIQRNRNDYVNVYGATINFPVKFSDTNYMVFYTDMTSQDTNIQNDTIVAGSNTLTFMNKTQNSITPMLISFSNGNYTNKGYNASNGCLLVNRFHCKVIGMCNE